MLEDVEFITDTTSVQEVEDLEKDKRVEHYGELDRAFKHQSFYVPGRNSLLVPKGMIVITAVGML